MSYATFSLHLKSTIDYHAYNLAQSKGLPFLDLAAATVDPAITESDQPAICWTFDDIGEFPQDPLWMASFDIGAMTLLDPSQYISLDIVGAIADAFKIGTEFDIYDFSGDDMPTEATGKMRVISCGVAPQQQDKETSVRFVRVGVVAYRE
jgi:hypothetical protein